MKRSLWVVLLTVAVGLAATGYGAVHLGLLPWSAPTPVAAAEPTAAPSQQATARILYYRHPDGQPAYSLEPQQTEDGRPWRPVRSDEDSELGPSTAPRPATAPPTPAASTARSDAGGQERRLLYYRNPMGLPDTSPVPKKDSMGMDYIPVFEGEGGEDGIVRVAPGRLQAAGVRSEPASRRVIARPVRAPGTIQLDERRVTVVALRMEAFVERVEDITTGDRVRRGQPLMQVYAPEVAAAAAQYISALSLPAGSGATAEGARRRLTNLAVPPAVLTEIDRSRRAPFSFAWPAPRDGVVLERTAVDGMRAAPGDVLFRIADTSLVWVLVDVPEREIGGLAVGGAVTVRVRGLPEQDFRGRIALLYPQVDMGTRTARLRVELPNPDGSLLPGMFAEAEVAVGSEAPVIAVPDGAVVDTGTRQLVILDRGEGRFQPRDVRAGRRGEGWIEIREGVVEGDRVVVAANFLIDAESNLRAALRGLTAATEPPR